VSRTARLLLLTLLVAGVAFGAGDEKSPPAKPAPKQAIAPDTAVGCTGGGVDVTVRLDYDPNRVGLISASYIDLGYAAPLALPADAPAADLRSRLKSLLDPHYRVGPPVNRGSSIRVPVTTTEPGIPADDLFTMRFDCPAGAQVRARDLACRTAELGDSAGQPMAEKLAPLVRCSVSNVAPAAAR
jgi:hypothetical protein